MGLNILTLGSGKTYTNMVALGISNMRTSGSTVYFTVAATGEEVSVTLPAPADGISITNVEVNVSKELIITLSDNTKVNAGIIPTVKGDKGDKLTFNDLTDAEKESLKGADGENGQDGFSPIAKVEKVGKVATITITDKDGTTTATVSDGSGSEGGEENVIDSISVNGVNVEPDDNKNVDITVPTKISDLSNDSGFLTEHQDISGKVDKVEGKSLISDSEIERLASVDNYNDTALSNRIKDVEDEVPNLATKTYVGEQIAAADHLKREIVTVLPSDENAKDNIIYMLKVESATGNDKYQEYMKIDGTVQLVGDTSVDLSDYAKVDSIPTTVAELTDSGDYAKTADVNTSLESKLDKTFTGTDVANKVLSTDDDGNVVLKDGGGAGWGTAETTTYTNESYPDYTNVDLALDVLFNKVYYVKPTCSLSASKAGGTFEMGTTISAPITFTWTTNKDITSQTLTGCTLANTSVRTATYDIDIVSDKTFTLSVSDGENSASSSVSYKFLNNIFWGSASTVETYDSTFISALFNKKLASAVKGTYSFNIASGEYGFWAVPSNVTISSVWIGGFEVTVDSLGTVSYTNAQGYTRDYNLYKTGKSGLGTISAEIK